MASLMRSCASKYSTGPRRAWDSGGGDQVRLPELPHLFDGHVAIRHDAGQTMVDTPAYIPEAK